MTDGTSQGLFVIVAVVIFGIFVTIAYSLFGDKLKLSLASIFEDSFTQAENALNGGEKIIVDAPTHLASVREDDKFKFVKIRDAYEENGETYSDIYIKVETMDDGNLKVVGANTKEEDATYNISSPSWVLKGGRFVLPKTIDGKQLTEIAPEVFSFSEFTGDLNLLGITKLSQGDFISSAFEGNFNAPELDIIISDNSSHLLNSSFTGNFNAPKLKEIPEKAFENSTFTGTFNAPEVTSIGQGAFTTSKFNGNFNAPKVKSIGQGAFMNSTFTGNFNAPELETIGVDAFVNVRFDGNFNAPKVTKIEANAFTASAFTGNFNAPKVTSIGGHAFMNSTFKGGTFDAPNVTNIGEAAFLFSEFTSANAPKLQTIGLGNPNLEEKLGK